MNKKKIILIILAVIVGLFILSTVLWSITGDMRDNGGNGELTDEEKDYLHNYNLSDVGNQKDENNTTLEEKVNKKRQEIGADTDFNGNKV
ncbi:hypothetical protein [Methanobrevibacter arboriphilus]|uniref:Uncharacterized protein n=1 Tax=Methanobrevibacter arboriphilus TaxID=39441 RepID=A0ACA8R5B7_METAZ|nr:hypothetical protein [Methanobrevibacter arboriphilus]BBL62643.1 hypothetical protein MarbSA_16830 [Methanobrevibacter arboriphilus]